MKNKKITRALIHVPEEKNELLKKVLLNINSNEEIIALW